MVCSKRIRGTEALREGRQVLCMEPLVAVGPVPFLVEAGRCN